MLGREDETGFSDEERHGLDIQYDRLYLHKTIRLNYMTYNLRIASDTLNVRNANVMVLLDEGDWGEDDGEPYGYAHVLGICHVMVKYAGPGKERTSFSDGRYQRIDVLRVRWFGRDMRHRSGWQHRRLPRLSFLPSNEYGAYGFLSPDDVVRGCHIMPIFRYGMDGDSDDEYDYEGYNSYCVGM